jgi:hypothetical protein
MIQRLLELLAKGKELRIRDLKSMLKEFDVQHKERLARQVERRIEVQKRRGEIRDLLVEFKKKRKESVKSWKTNPPKANPPVRKAEEVNPVRKDIAEDVNFSNGANEDNSVSNRVNIDVQKKTDNEEIPPKSGGI